MASKSTDADGYEKMSLDELYDELAVLRKDITAANEDDDDETADQLGKKKRRVSALIKQKEKESSGATKQDPTLIENLTQIFKTLDAFMQKRSILLPKDEDWDIPTFAVVGPQSHGKSTILERLTQLNIFPKKAGLCTKLPIRIRLRYAKKFTGKLKMFVQQVNGKVYKMTKILPFTLPEGEALVQHAMEQAITKQDKHGIGMNKYILLELRGPEYPNLELLDLPGLVASGGPGSFGEATHILANRWLDELKGRCAILLVRALTEGPTGRNSQSLHLIEARKKNGTFSDSDEKWTIGVFTKADKSDPRTMVQKLLQTDCDDPPAPKLETNGYVLTASKEYPEYPPEKKLTPKLFSKKIEKQNRGERDIFVFRKDEADPDKKQLRDLVSPIGKKSRATVSSLMCRLENLYKGYLKDKWLPETLYRLMREYERLEALRWNIGMPEWHEKRSESSKTPNLTKGELFANHLMPAIRDLVTRANALSMQNKDVIGVVLKQLSVDTQRDIAACSKTGEIRMDEFAEITTLHSNAKSSLYSKLSMSAAKAIRALDVKLVQNTMECIRGDRHNGHGHRTKVRLGRFPKFLKKLETQLTSTAAARFQKTMELTNAEIRRKVLQLCPTFDYDKLTASFTWDTNMSASIVYVVMSLTRAAFIDQVETILKTGLAVTDVDDIESDSDMRQEIIDTQQKILIARHELLKLVVGMQRASGGGTIDVEKALPHLKRLMDVDLDASSFEVVPKISLIAGKKAIVKVSLASKTKKSICSKIAASLPIKVVLKHANWTKRSCKTSSPKISHAVGGSVGNGFEYAMPKMSSHLTCNEMKAEVCVAMCGQRLSNSPMTVVVQHQDFCSSATGNGHPKRFHATGHSKQFHKHMRVEIKFEGKWYSGTIEKIIQYKRNGIGVQCDGDKKGILTWGTSANIRALYSKGDRVSYVKDEICRPATVVDVVHGREGPSYTIKFDDNGHTRSTVCTYLQLIRNEDDGDDIDEI